MSSQVTVISDGALLSWKLLDIWQPEGSSEQFSYFALFVRSAFALSFKLSSSQPMNFLGFIFSILLPIPLSHLWGVNEHMLVLLVLIVLLVHIYLLDLGGSGGGCFGGVCLFQ